MDRELFEKLVEEGLLGIPEGLRERLENVEVVIEDEPSPALLDKMGVRRGGTLLGLYQGVPITSRGFYYGNVLPDRIVLYMGPISRNCKSAEDIPGLVREVVVHEVGHYFGLSDTELRRLEGR